MAGGLFRRLQAGAVGPLVQIFQHALMARANRRLGVSGRALGLDVFVHRLAPSPRKLDDGNLALPIALRNCYLVVFVSIFGSF